MSSIDNLRKNAKRWLKALRARDSGARGRLARAWPEAPTDPGLRDIHHALALEQGQENWTALKAAAAAGVPPPAAAGISDQLVATFLSFACWDHRTHGKGEHRMHDRAAQRLLAHQPTLARQSLCTALVCGDIEEVRRRLVERPAAATEPGGSRGWTPILYLAYTRFTHSATLEHGVEIARLLLDHGAGANDFYMAGDSQYSALVGAAGEGEQDSPRQPYAEALYRLLLDRGAGPYDIQVLYNTHFSGDMLWWLELTYQRSLALGRKADWEDPAWSMLDMGGYGPGAYFILKTAAAKNRLALATWALEHGASPNVMSSSDPKFKPEPAVYDLAAMEGFTEMADLLRRHGATAGPELSRPEHKFIAACMRLDPAAASALIQAHPEFRRSPLAMFEAAKRDRVDVLALLVDLGVPIDVADDHNTHALHHAAASNALGAARFLIDRGADIDPRESAYGGAPIGWAAHSDHRPMLDYLSQYSRAAWTLAFRGYSARLRELLRQEPGLARQIDSEGNTLLWWLPDDEATAMAIVEMLLAAGADPAARNHGGRTATDWALTRGMMEIAHRLGGSADSPATRDGTELDEGLSADAAPSGASVADLSRPIVWPPPEPADVPVEMRVAFPVRLHDGTIVQTKTVWRMLTAARDGDLASVVSLVEECPSLVYCDYNSTPPLHLAVREGHLEVVRFLAEHGAVNPNYRTYPYRETLATVAEDRGYAAIAAVLDEYGRGTHPDRPEDESGEIDYGRDLERQQFERLVNANALGAVETLLKRRPELAIDPFAFWSEGILMRPAHGNHWPMLELLMSRGARVPGMTKWGREYYFKHYDTAAFLMARGMSADHMNCDRTTLLHGMAQLGEVRKAGLLLEHGADIDAVDNEFRSTPLGLAARWGHLEMVRMLLARGADPGKAGADWATPALWARRKGHRAIASELG